MKAYARNFLYSPRYGAIMYCMRYVCYHDHIGRDFVIGQFCVLYGVSIGGGAEIGLVENRQPYYYGTRVYLFCTRSKTLRCMLPINMDVLII